ncbi:MAG: GNAT family N-acetyltransferase [Phenylobacterium sp.]
MADEFTVRNNAEAGRFEVVVGDDVAFTEYRRLANGILFPHTEVPPAFEGKGVAGKIVRTALDWARSEGQKVMPTCTFVAGWIQKHPDYHDLVHDQYRSTLGLK